MSASVRGDDTAQRLFAGEGELRARCRAFDWTTTVLGSVEEWPPSLRTTASTVVAMGFPAILLWGPQFVQIYNDAYKPFLGSKHPAALGSSSRECWSEIWPLVEPVLHRVQTGETVTLGDQYYPLLRQGPAVPHDDVYITLSYVPVRDEGGGVSGILITGFDTTSQVEAHGLEKKRQALEVDTSRAELRAASVLERMADAHATLDSEFRFLTVNPAALRAVDKTLEEMVGRTHWEVFPASLDMEIAPAYRRIVAEGVEAHFKQHYVGDGYDVHLDLDAYPTDEGGVAIFWRDVSEHVRTEAALAASEALFRTVQDVSPHGVVLMHPMREDDRPDGGIVDFRLTYANPAAGRLGGREPTDMVGRGLVEMFPATRQYGLFEGYQRVAETGEVFETDLMYQADGLDYGLGITAVRVGDDVALTTADITARLRAETESRELFKALDLERTRLAEVFRQSPSFFAVLRGPDHVFELANDAYYQLIGRREIIGKPAFEALPELRGKGFEGRLHHVLATGEPFVGRELPITVARTWGALPEERFVDVTYLPFIERDGTRGGVIFHGADVTARVRARLEIERLLAESEKARADAEAARAEAEAANRTKSEFLATISHEYRTPLNAIGGYAELIEIGVHGPVTPEQRTALDRIQRSQRHLLGLINGVLNYAKVDAGAVLYNSEKVLLDEAVATCEALSAPQARAKRLSLRFTGCDPRLAARADREKVQQVVLNLLSNAIKFTAPGGSVDVQCVRVGDSQVAVHVSDTGLGIAAEQMERVFQPFVQIDAGLTRTQEGTGLGLAISRDLARGMNGDLKVESVEGQGSTFTITLPRWSD